MSLLTFVQDICDELALPRPSVVVGSNDAIVRQLLRSIYRIADDMMDRADWSELVKTHGVVLIPGTSTYAYPPDFRRIINDTQWDTGDNWRLKPMTNQEYALRQYGLAAAPVHKLYMARSYGTNQFLVYPTPTEADTLTFTYISNNWIYNPSPAYDSTFLTDSDTFLLPSDTLAYGVMYYWKMLNDLPYQNLQKLYEDNLSIDPIKKQGAKKVSITSRRFGRFLSSYNIPDSGYGS